MIEKIIDKNKKAIIISMILMLVLPMIIYLLFGDVPMKEKLGNSVFALILPIMTILMMFFVLGFHVLIGTSKLFPKFFSLGCNFFIIFGFFSLVIMVISQVFSYFTGDMQLQEGIPATMGIVIGAYLVKKKYVVNQNNLNA